MANIFNDIPQHPLPGEIFTPILNATAFRIERIVSRGHCSPEGFWYDQDESEWVLLLKGNAGLHFADRDELVILNPGDYIHIAKHRRHRVEWTDKTQETIWLAVHYR